jgi:hypothetical protein
MDIDNTNKLIPKRCLIRTTKPVVATKEVEKSFPRREWANSTSIFIGFTPF